MKDSIRTILGRCLALALRLRGAPLPVLAGRLLFIAPHADDETLGGGGLIAARCRDGQEVEVAFLTDSAGTPGSPALAARRRTEALSALAELGLSARHVHFLTAIDGRLDQPMDSAWQSARDGLASLLRQQRPDAVFLPYLGGGSTEHDGAHRLFADAARKAGWNGAIWEYPIWAWWNRLRLYRQLTRYPENHFLPLGDLRPRKIRALACHVSQLPNLPPALVTLCTGPYEFYFRR